MKPLVKRGVRLGERDLAQSLPRLKQSFRQGAFTPDAAFYTSNKLRKKGAEIYIYNGGFHHSKIMMVDSLFCTVGSTNLNSRSLRYDYEVNAFIFDKETTHELSSMFEDDKKDSTLLTKEEYKKRSAWKRFVGWFANMFTPFL